MRDPEGILSHGEGNIRAALDALNDLFYVFDTSHRLVAWNDALAEITGYSDTELHGMAPREFIHKQDHEKFNAYLDRVSETGSGTVLTKLVTKEGGTIPYEFYSDILTDEDGEVIGRVGVGRDISERVEYQQALERENERLDEFASTLAHDLRNPLTVAKGRIEHLAGVSDEVAYVEHFTAIDEALTRIERIITDVLHLSQTGEIGAEQEAVNLAEMARRVWGQVEHGQAELTIEDEVWIRADASLLERLLTNLFRNAVEHGGDGVHLRVGALASPFGFYVADDGPGIPEAEQERVFEWKYSTKSEGFGVGLQSVRKVCNAHGWEIRVIESADGGARFEITDVKPANE
jgi:PAS domain S-box-containing protein